MPDYKADGGWDVWLTELQGIGELCNALTYYTPVEGCLLLSPIWTAERQVNPALQSTPSSKLKAPHCHHRGKWWPHFSVLRNNSRHCSPTKTFWQESKSVAQENISIHWLSHTLVTDKLCENFIIFIQNNPLLRSRSCCCHFFPSSLTCFLLVKPCGLWPGWTNIDKCSFCFSLVDCLLFVFDEVF